MIENSDKRFVHMAIYIISYMPLGCPLPPLPLGMLIVPPPCPVWVRVRVPVRLVGVGVVGGVLVFKVEFLQVLHECGAEGARNMFEIRRKTAHCSRLARKWITTFRLRGRERIEGRTLQKKQTKTKENRPANQNTPKISTPCEKWIEK